MIERGGANRDQQYFSAVEQRRGGGRISKATGSEAPLASSGIVQFGAASGENVAILITGTAADKPAPGRSAARWPHGYRGPCACGPRGPYSGCRIAFGLGQSLLIEIEETCADISFAHFV
jgi:hypothetical protein